MTETGQTVKGFEPISRDDLNEAINDNEFKWENNRVNKEVRGEEFKYAWQKFMTIEATKE